MASTNTRQTVTLSTRWFLIALAIAFLIGLIPMWILAHGRATQADHNAQQVLILRLETEIASAALHGKRGEYEPARKAASDFFTNLRYLVDGGQILTDAERNASRQILAQRDDVITLLARNDPAGVDRLFGLEYQLSQALKNRQ